VSIHLNILHRWKPEGLAQFVALSKETNRPINQWVLGWLHGQTASDPRHRSRALSVIAILDNAASLQVRQAGETVEQTLNRLSAGLQQKDFIRE